MSRIFSGIQPSGELHIGNYLGAVKNWVALQRQYESFFCIVDYHAITVPYEPADLRRRTRDMAISLLASGIDPSRARCSCSQRSRNIPSSRGYSTRSRRSASSSGRRSSRRSRAGRRASPSGLLNYPVLQAADILLYKADMVPVGEDQVQHLELSREMSRWNGGTCAGSAPGLERTARYFSRAEAAADSDAAHHGPRRQGEDVEVARQHGRVCSRIRRTSGKSCGRR